MARVLLSFDNGPDADVTPRVLATLAAHRAPAWFFVLGRQLALPGGLALARRIRDAGHHLGNHSWSHAVPLGEDPRPDAVARELEATHALLAPLIEGAPWFRPFGGGGRIGRHLLSGAALDWLVAHEATCALWSVVPGDWLDAEGWVDRALAEIALQEHAVVVLHDVLPDAMARLDAFLGALREAGHTLTTDWPDAVLPVRDGRVAPWAQGCVTPVPGSA